MFLGIPESNSSTMLVDSQLLRLSPAGILAYAPQLTQAPPGGGGVDYE